MSSPQTASEMFPSSVRYGDVVFIGLPDATGGPAMVYTGTPAGGDIYVTAGQKLDITSAQPYVIYNENKEIPGETTIYDNAHIVLVLYDVSSISYWYNGDNSELEISTDTFDSSDQRSIFYLALTAGSSGDPITYESQFTIQNLDDNEYVTYDPSDPTENLIITDKTTSGPNSNFQFLFTGINVTDSSTTNNNVGQQFAKLQCCTNNPAYNQFCGQYQPGGGRSACDTILTNYCTGVTTTDLNCGCLLPPSYYTIDGNADTSYPYCIDNRCINAPDAYNTSIQLEKPCSITDVECTMILSQDTFNNVSIVAFNQSCGTDVSVPSLSPSPNGGNGTNYTYIIIAIIIILIIVLIGIGIFAYVISKK